MSENQDQELVTKRAVKEAIKLIVMEFGNFEDVINRIPAIDQFPSILTIEKVKSWLKRRVADFIVAPGRGQIEIDFDHMFQHLEKDLELEQR